MFIVWPYILQVSLEQVYMTSHEQKRPLANRKAARTNSLNTEAISKHKIILDKKAALKQKDNLHSEAPS